MPAQWPRGNDLNERFVVELISHLQINDGAEWLVLQKVFAQRGGAKFAHNLQCRLIFW